MSMLIRGAHILLNHLVVKVVKKSQDQPWKTASD